MAFMAQRPTGQGWMASPRNPLADPGVQLDAPILRSSGFR